MKRQRKAGREVMLIITIMVLALVLMMVVMFMKYKDREKIVEISSTPQETVKILAKEEEKLLEKTITIRAVGDALYHDNVMRSGLLADGTYNFDHIFENIKAQMEEADISIINQETMLGGKELGISYYPTFNSPTEAGQALVENGFDVVMHANNHSLDKGVAGIEKTLEFWEKYPDMLTLGINEDEADQNRPRILEIEGVKFAFINHTESLNGIALPQAKPYVVDVLSEERLAKDVELAKKEADFIIALPHWGAEYVYSPVESQLHFAKVMADLGVDLIIGTHPHVLQPFEWITGKNGNKTLVYYSLGNFVSGQDRVPRMLGGMAQIELKITGDKISIENASLKPLVTHFEGDEFAVYFLSEYNNDLARKHSINARDGSGFSVEILDGLISEIFGQSGIDAPKTEEVNQEISEVKVKKEDEEAEKPPKNLEGEA